MGMATDESRGPSPISRSPATNAPAVASSACSREINQSKGKYYDVLESTQRGTLDLTAWLSWFLDSYTRAIVRARSVAEDVLRSDAFWRKHANVVFSERQRHVLNRYMHQFEGNLTTKKWAALTKSSPATATRDILDLIEKGVLAQNPGGSKNTSFSLVGFDRTKTSSIEV